MKSLFINIRVARHETPEGRCLRVQARSKTAIDSKDHGFSSDKVRHPAVEENRRKHEEGISACLQHLRHIRHLTRFRLADDSVELFEQARW